MKNKPILLLAVLFALAAPANAQHLAVGAGAGTDGLSVELAVPLGSHIQLRAGYGAAVGLAGYTLKSVSIPVHPGNPSGTSATVPLTFKLGLNEGSLLFNIYPGKGGFHFTAGAYLGSPRLIRAIFKDMPSDYNTVGVNVDGYLVKAQNGVLETSLHASGLGPAAFAIKPYAGIGYGRTVGNGRVGFSVDLGAQYTGKASFWASGESLTGRTRQVEITGDALEDLVPGFGEKSQKYLRWLVVWPTLSAHVYVKLF